MRRTALAALCIVAATTAGLTGCQADQSGQDKADSKSQTEKTEKTEKKEEQQPFDGLSGGEIVTKAFKATTGASSLRVAGKIPGGQGSDAVEFDMSLSTKGECAGTMSIGGAGEAELIRTGDTFYLKYDEAFLRAQSEGEPAADTDAAVSLLAGKWTKMPATGQDAKDFDAFCDLDSLLEGFSSEGGSNATRGKTTEVAGVPALALEEKDGADRYTVYVATEGQPYVLRIDSPSASEPDTLTFDDYDKPVRADKPAGEILDLETLGG